MSDKIYDPIKLQMEEMIFDLLTTMVEQKIPIRVVLTNEERWDREIPQSVIEQGDVIAIDLENQSLEDTFYDVETDNIVLTTGFENEAYTRYIDPSDIVAIIDISNLTPIFIKPFVSERVEDFSFDTTEVNQIVDRMKDTKEFKHSLKCLKLHNPELFNK